MSQAPFLLSDARQGMRFGHGKVVDSLLQDGLWDAFNDYGMGVTAENLAQQYGIDREAQDRFAGLYLDTKVNYAPDDRNAYTSDFQVTLFDIGLFPGRQQDMTSLGYTRSFISHKFRDSLKPADLEAQKSINAISLSHAFRLVTGIYWINGITWQDNPTLVPKRDDAILYQSSMYWNF